MERDAHHRLLFSVSAAVLVSDSKGKLLLLQQDSEIKEYKWGPIAGGVDEHEDPRLAAKREAKEEVGVRIGLADLVGIYTIERDNLPPGVGFVFRGFIEAGEISPKQGEIKNWNYFSKRETLEMLASGQIYKPEYNRQGILDYFVGNSFPIGVVRPFVVSS